MNVTIFNPGPQQTVALSKIEHWLTHEVPGKQVFKLSGYAGTGKTTLAIKAAALVQGEVAFASFTGKAALRMQMAGCDGAMTLHKLIYTPIDDGHGKTRFVVKHKSSLSNIRLVIVDEASMIDMDLGRDLLSFGVPVLAIGDPAQLPPIKGVGRFSVGEPDVMLTEIHRQGAGSPVLMLAKHARMGQLLPMGDHGSSRVIGLDALDNSDLLSVDQIIVGRNTTRHAFNAEIRNLKGFADDLPVIGDKLICEANDADYGLFNGAMFRVAEIGSVDRSEGTIDLTVVSIDIPDDEPFRVTIPIECFSRKFKSVDWRREGVQWMSYGYAITAHKAQGSEWTSALVVNESEVFRQDAARWLYTAVTRARERVIVVS